MNMGSTCDDKTDLLDKKPHRNKITRGESSINSRHLKKPNRGTHLSIHPINIHTRVGQRINQHIQKKNKK